MQSLRLVLLLALSMSSAFGATVSTGDSFPLTNTRYHVQSGDASRLVSNGHEVFLFWRTATHFHCRRTDWVDHVPARAVMESRTDDVPSVVWTGSHFLFVVGRGTGTLTTNDDVIVGQLIDRSGELSGEPFLLASQAKYPQLVFDSTTVRLLWTHSTGEILMLPLRADGRPSISAPRLVGLSGVIESLAANAGSLAAVVSDGAFVSATRTLVLFDAGVNVVASSHLGAATGGVSLAAGHDRYLLAEGQPRLHTRLVESDGSLGAAMQVEPFEVYSPSVAWTGSKWVIASTPFLSSEQLMGFSVVHVDAENEIVEARERHSGDFPALAAAGGRVVVGWRRPTLTIAFAEAPLDQATGRDASVVAARQEVIATASATHGTLILWWESEALHAGVRMNDGRWIEQLLWPDRSPAAVAAATDGQAFTVVLSERVGAEYTPTILRLDPQGLPIGAPERSSAKASTPLIPLWTGREYAVVSPNSIVWTAVSTTASNLLPGPVVDGHEESALAASPDGFYAVWLFGGHFGSPSWPPTGVAGIRLGPDFKPLDAMPTVFAGGSGGNPPYYSGCDVAWDGQQYVVTWTGDGVTAAQVPATSGAPVTRLIAEAHDDHFMSSPKLTRVADGVALHWYRTRVHPQRDLVELAIVSRDGTVTPAMGFETPDDYSSPDSRLITAAALPGGDVAIVRTARQDEVPIDGSVRLAMNVVSAVPLPDRPRAPRMTATRVADDVSLAWDAPPERINGYRVEFRIDDQPWFELDSVLPPERRSLSIPHPAPGRNVSFRVRAWNEAGLGQHSSPVVPTKPSRRRAVR